MLAQLGACGNAKEQCGLLVGERLSAFRHQDLGTVKCEFLQCTVLGKHGAVSDDVTLRGRDVIFFLKQAKIILRCRYAPGMPRPGVSK